MGTKTFFFTQLASILVYIGTLIGLYALLVRQKDATIDQKDATIQLLKERIDVLQKDLEKAKESSPDVLMQRLNDRVKVLTDEIERLSKDKDANEALIQQKDKELSELNGIIEDARRRLTNFTHAIEIANDGLRRSHEAMRLNQENKTADQLNP